MSKKQFAVLGLGRFGQSIVKTFVDNGYSVLACDSNPHKVSEVAKIATHCAEVDVTDEDAIISLGLNNFDVVIIAIGGDMKASILATILAKQHGAKFVLAKALDTIHELILRKIGADHIILPEKQMGIRTALNLISDNIVDSLIVNNEYSIIEISARDEWFGKSLKELDFRNNYNVNVVLIERDSKTIANMTSAEQILPGDLIFVLIENSKVSELAQLGKFKNK